MKRIADGIRLSATDLAGHLACRHLTTLGVDVAWGRREEPRSRRPELETLHELGQRHERAYLDHLDSLGLNIVRLEDPSDSKVASNRTAEAMQSGAAVIFQPTLSRGRWHGRADFLQRVERPSKLGGWSYEVYDTKLAQETRGGTILQLCLYSDIVGMLQGMLPECMHVVSPGPGFEPQTYRTRDFMAYYRLVKRRLEEVVNAATHQHEVAPTPTTIDAVGQIAFDFDGSFAAHPALVAKTYPEPVIHCDVCRWWPVCDRQRRDDDHLSLVAGISRLQTRELQAREVSTLEALAEHPVPLGWKPDRGSTESYEKVRAQALIQLKGRQHGEPLHELLAREPLRGLARLPDPSRGDVFLDLEGDPFAGPGGLEYVFGYVTLDDSSRPDYRCSWATGRAAEKAAFEDLIDEFMKRWERDPDLHIYHFAPYEPAALKRLMGRYATREAEVDRLLRGRRFVDLHAIVRQSLRASVEKYSIKDLERFYGFERAMALDEAGPAIRKTERALELGHIDAIDNDDRAKVEAYNRDDCVSTLHLRDWLERLRAELVAGGEAIGRPAAAAAEPKPELDARDRRVQALAERLAGDVAVQPEDRTEEQHARWLLAHLLGWHRREDKAPWWEYFRLLDLTEYDLHDERSALAGLEFVEELPAKRSPIQRYTFPAQEVTIRAEDKLHTLEGLKLGEVVAIDLVGRTVDIKKPRALAGEHPTAAFEHDSYTSFAQAEALYQLGAWVADHRIDAPGKYRAARDLLLNRAPRLNGAIAAPGVSLRKPGEDAVHAARRLALDLDHGVLAIQGPPGTGKTYSGSRMICDLVRAGKKIGVTAGSHKVIRNLLDEVMRAAAAEGVAIQCVQKPKKISDDPDPRVREIGHNEEVLAALQGGTADVTGGTPYMWSRQEFLESVDVLFIDEAGQLSLANALAVAGAAKNMVLLGDPQQLEQPQQASHPDGADVSALEHMLAGADTLADDRGLFLDQTWRLHPILCEFTSESFYEGRLSPRAGLERQCITGAEEVGGLALPARASGFWFVAVEHTGNTSAAAEEVRVVRALVESLVQHGSGWLDRCEKRLPLTLDDILIIAPYNAQVADLSVAIRGARVGTVDKFQGQEAPIVIYSTTTSTPEDAPRGMEFLYSMNRLNVATSRARCACLVVGNPRLFEPDCQTPRQMRLANGFCALGERVAATIPPERRP